MLDFSSLGGIDVLTEVGEELDSLALVAVRQEGMPMRMIGRGNGGCDPG